MNIIDARGLGGLHLYHHGLSSCSQRVRIALDELGLPWTSHIVDLRLHHHLSPEYRAINPAALVPALIDGDAVIVESCTILVHLDVSAGHRLGGADDPLLAVADAAQGPLKTLTHEWMFRTRGAPDPNAPQHPDPAARAFARDYAEDGPAWAARLASDRAAMVLAMADAEVRLAYGPWLGGARLSLADIAWLPTIHRMALLGWPLLSRTRAWYARFRARPGFDAGVTAWEPAGFAEAQAEYVARRRAAGTGVEQALARAVA
jgi:glutathione S-transferase